MRKVGLLAVVLLVAGLAQAQVKFGAGPHLGISFASAPEPLDKVYGFGFGFGAHGDAVFSKYFTARLSFDYHIFPADEDELVKYFGGNFTLGGQQITAATGAGTGMISIMASGIGKLPLGGSVTPYAIVGIGYGSISTSNLKLAGAGGSAELEVESDSGLSLQFGAGAEFAVSKAVSIFGEVKYALIFGSEKTDQQSGQKSGGTSTHLPISFGATFWF
jgi:opacity protein-like surface antigen